jgi:hypothetical protein
MTRKRWPILGLDGDATEGEIRRAYAKRLREQGPDADVASFQALRAEFEAALATVRTGTPVIIVANATMRANETWQPLPDPRAGPLIERQPLAGDPPSLRDVPEAPLRSGRVAIEEIRHYLNAGDLAGACDRFDLARAADEIDLATESEIELELARSWLTDTTLDAAARAQLVRRYRWDDVMSGFPLGEQIAARLQADALPVRKPGERFIGQWNWGAFCLTPFWLIAHGLVKRGVLVLVVDLLLLVVPLGFLGALWLAIYFGRNGNALAVKARAFTSDQQFVAVQHAWRNAGIAFLGVTAFCFIIVAASIIAHR